MLIKHVKKSAFFVTKEEILLILQVLVCLYVEYDACTWLNEINFKIFFIPKDMIQRIINVCSVIMMYTLLLEVAFQKCR